MPQPNFLTKVNTFWKKNQTSLVFCLLSLIFAGYAAFTATHLQRDIVPDEPYHLLLTQGFAETWGVPQEVETAKSAGVHIRQNPYLAYWFFGRALNGLQIVLPDASEWQQLVMLRLVNVLFALGTVVFTYLFSKELIQHRWWRLLPVFALTNTLMFVLLSAGVSYDNLTNFLCIAGLYLLLNVLKQKAFIPNSLGWLICLTLGALTKETVLPLALGMSIVWALFIYKNRPRIAWQIIKKPGTILLMIFLIILIAGNLSIYGVNLIKHQSLTPSCQDYFTKAHCDSSAFAQRRQALALPEKPTILQAFRQGYPEPIRYAFDTWIRAMLMKVFGIMGGQKSYYPIGIAYFQILLYWYIALAIRYFRKTTFKVYSLAGIFAFYTLTLFIKNYDIELAYGFIQVALQGRYLFPVIGIAYGLGTLGLMNVPNKWIRWGTLIVTILLFLYSGPIRFILYRYSVFADWFI